MNIVGIMWNKNEDDILDQIIEAAMPKVDSLFIADDGSTDSSWQVINTYAYHNPDKIEHIQQKPNPNDPGQRQSLLDEVRRRYKPEDTWVQIIESDIQILDTDVRHAIKMNAVEDLGVTWLTLNACRKEWIDWDTYPNWNMPLSFIMPMGHLMEIMLYTFRPIPEVSYKPGIWRPWPSGWSKVIKNPPLKDWPGPEYPPLLAHFGYRGPTHFYNKYKNMGRFHKKYKTWCLDSPASVAETVPYFNGQWTGQAQV
ncbi:MAG: glycosyltransferase [Candidatus Thorarchaeota archaeon]|jgi:glycosyltransferase involved in cell wall biosynthesis